MHCLNCNLNFINHNKYLDFNKIQSDLPNPMINHIYQSKCDKYFTDPEVLENIPNMFLLLGGVFGALGIIATILISEPNQSKEDQDEMSSIQDKTSTDQMTQTFSLTPIQVLGTRTFYQVLFKCRLQYASSSALKQNQSINKNRTIWIKSIE